MLSLVGTAVVAVAVVVEGPECILTPEVLVADPRLLLNHGDGVHFVAFAPKPRDVVVQVLAVAQAAAQAAVLE